jgi:hypothetical protein
VTKITVCIESDTATNLRSALRELLADTLAGQAAAEQPTAPEPAKPAKSRKATDSKPAEESVADPATDQAPAAAKTYSQVELREAVQPLRGAVVRQLVAALCGKSVDGKLKLTDIPAEKHAEFMAEVQRLAQLPENVKQGATNE